MDVRDSFSVSAVRTHLEKQEGAAQKVLVNTRDDMTVFEVYPEDGTDASGAIDDETREMLKDTYGAEIEVKETMGDEEPYLDVRISGLMDDSRQ